MPLNAMCITISLCITIRSRSFQSFLRIPSVVIFTIQSQSLFVSELFADLAEVSAAIFPRQPHSPLEWLKWLVDPESTAETEVAGTQ